MHVRPLDLASQLRPEPRSFDAFHFVNIGLLLLFFALFGSRFVLGPAVVIKDAPLLPPAVPAETLSFTESTAVVSIKSNGQIFTPEIGRTSFSQLQVWLAQKARQANRPSLLVVADRSVSYQELSRLYAAASEHGFVQISLAAEPVPKDAP